MKKHLKGKLLSALLSVAMVFALAAPGFAAPAAHQTPVAYEQVDNLTLEKLGAQEETASPSLYGPDDPVRASIVLEEPSTLDAGFSAIGVGENEAAIAYRRALAQRQAAVTAAIEELLGRELDVVWNLTLAANIISANVPYGMMDAIKGLEGVKDVVPEAAYTPMEAVGEGDAPLMTGASSMLGLTNVYSSGYTGAGSLVAVIDTGTDTDHELFDAGAFDYALSRTGASPKLTVAGVAAVLGQLNAARKYFGLRAQALYISSKLPFSFNYADNNLRVTHEDGYTSGHGSHVAGIAVGNRFVPDGNGGYVSALDTVLTQGVAPDAQLVTMKVFGADGSAYDSDYMAAIEDAIILGCDSINLSLGSSCPGFTRSETYEELLDGLTRKDAVVVMAAGNAGAWADYAGDTDSNLLLGDVNFATVGDPASLLNSLSVASVDNAGVTGVFIVLSDGTPCTYSERTSSMSEPLVYYSNLPIAETLGRAEPYEFVYVDTIGTEADFAAVAHLLAGKIAICNRGETAFYEKAEAAVRHGALALIAVNNVPGVINMDLTDYTMTNPCVSVTLEMGQAIKATGTLHPAVEGQDGSQAIPAYYTGTLTINAGIAFVPDSAPYTMSDFSSWGVSGSLVLKPEIAAPGGEVYSADGTIEGGKSYITHSGTSMAAPQVAGLAAVLAQYIRENDLTALTGLSPRVLTQSLLMSTAVPLRNGDDYYPVLQQGAGLANLEAAVGAASYILMKSDATVSYADGKVKAELGDDPERVGVYTFSFSLNNLTSAAQQYTLSADLFTQAVDGGYLSKGVTGLSVEAGFSTGNTVTLPANGSVDVTVTLTLPQAAKALLNGSYPTGAYLEGYVTVSGSTTHTIPVLGYYGSWTEPSMFEPVSHVEKLYNEDAIGYVLPNSISLIYPGEAEATTFTGNPYTVENTIPTQRYAISSATVIQGYAANLIRPAGSAFAILTNEAGEVLYMGDDLGQSYGAYFDAEIGFWTLSTDSGPAFPVDRLVAELGVAEGEKLTLSAVAIPEYYEVDGPLTTQQLQALLESDALGAGAFLSTTFTVDDTAPRITAIYHNTLTGELTVEARDNNYVAYVDLLNGNGVSMTAGGLVPAQTRPNQTGSVLFELSGAPAGTSYLLVVGDYAGNEVTYALTYNDESCPSNAFSDLNLYAEGWYHAGVDYMLEQGLMSGLSATIFGPLATSNRATIVTILYRLAGSPEVTEPSGFVDVPEGRWFSAAIAWAKENGVVSGVSETEFAPLRTLSRQEAVTMLYRYVGQPAVTGDLSAFTDGDRVGNYARDAMTWAVSNGLIVGTNGQLLPRDPMNRAAMALVLARYLQSVEG